MYPKIFKGSSWSKWDLHIHTPCSIVQEYGGNRAQIWDKFIQDLESLPSEYKVIGINDYLFLDGYKKVLEFKKHGRLTNIDIFLPIIELRTRALGGISFNANSRINLHVIFSNELSPEDIDRLFLSQIKWSKHLSPGTKSDYVGLSRAEVERFGKVIRDTSPRASGTDLELGFNNLNIEEDLVYSLLDNELLRHYSFTAIGIAEWSDFRWTASAAEKKHLPNRATFLFTGSPSVAKYNTGRDNLKADQVNDLLLHCSDAHCFSDNPHSEEIRKIGHCYTWIKGEYIFESLRQLQFERNGRLLVTESTPATPPRTIDRIHLKFKEQTLIAKKGKPVEEHNIFCLAGERVFEFSPYFTCLIGGRGSGKSTVLNLLAEALGNDTDFFKSNNLWCDNQRINPKDYVTVEGSQEIDFIAQSQVEDLADSPQLTDMIYDRLRQFAGRSAGFEKYETDFKLMCEGFTSQITMLKLQSETQNQLIEKNTELIGNKNIISSFKSEEFQELNHNITKVESKIQLLNSAKERYNLFRAKLTELIISMESKNDYSFSNPYDKFIDNATQNMKKILDQSIDNDDFESMIIDLDKEKTNLRLKLDTYLQGQNLSQENINDFENAVIAVPRLEEEIKILEKNLTIQNNQILSFENQFNQFKQKKSSFEEAIQKALTPLNTRLKQPNKQVAEIRFEYNFDEDKARKALFDDFLSEFREFRDVRTVEDTLQSLLFLIPPTDTTTFTWDEMRNILERQNRSTNALDILRRIFEKEHYFKLYQLFMLRRFLNPFDFKKINVFYGNKPLDSCSFGQRCTAVLVTLMAFGNKPLVVDEPEAHLDSRLIADYLVDLVKQNKLHRQIIFATHNANFVINGDAELIHILKVEENLKTHCVSTSIENTNHRPRLIELEGGVEAFQKREQKLLVGRRGI